MSDFGHWSTHMPFEPENWFGFIYRITELSTGKEYIGKKQFHKRIRKPVKGKTRRKIVISESDWKTYTGSSTELNQQIAINGKENYKFEIISLHNTKGSLYYEEVRMQIVEDVLREKFNDGTKKYYNKMINSVKFIPPSETEDEKKYKDYKNNVDK